VTTAQFFTNSIDTRTTGVDLVAAYARGLGRGTLTLTGSANFTKTEVRRVNVPQSMADTFRTSLTTIRNRILNPEDRNRLEDAMPRSKDRSRPATASVGSRGWLAHLLRRHRVPPSDRPDSQRALRGEDPVRLRSVVRAGSRRALCGRREQPVQHLSDRQVHAVNESFGRFVYSRRVTQFGMNGGFYYARLLLSL